MQGTVRANPLGTSLVIPSITVPIEILGTKIYILGNDSIQILWKIKIL